jgi:hypothetical protein
MGRPRFFESLDILNPATQAEKAAMATAGLKPELALSVCAMGPLDEGDKILAMRVWIWQVVDGQVRASAGNAGVHLGGHDLEDSEIFPLLGTDTSKMWMVQTQLEPHSPQFVNEKPALATAMALIERGGSVDLEHWSQAVMIQPHEGGHGEEEHDGPHEGGHHHPPPSPPT